MRRHGSATPEGAVLAAVMDYLALILRWPVYRRNVGATVIRPPGGRTRFVRFSQPGQSDLWGIIPVSGRHYEIECKAPGKKPTPEQEAWLASCRASGAVAVWCDSVEMLQAKLRECGL